MQLTVPHFLIVYSHYEVFPLVQYVNFLHRTVTTHCSAILSHNNRSVFSTMLYRLTTLNIVQLNSRTIMRSIFWPGRLGGMGGGEGMQTQGMEGTLLYDFVKRECTNQHKDNIVLYITACCWINFAHMGKF